MVLKELSESEWQRSYVPVLRLAGSSNSSSSNKLGGDPTCAREHAVGDVKHIMDKTIGRRCCRISGAVSAANYLEVPREARTAPLNLTGRFVYIQVRPIGDKVMTFHLDVLDAGGQPERVTFSTLYSAPHATHDGHHSNAAAVTSSATTLETWKGVGRGGALRYPVSFDTSRSRGWSVVAVDMVALMREGGGGREYGLLRAVRLGSNMVVRGVYASDCVYSPHTLPKDMAFRPPGGGVDWETAYTWLWLPERLSYENAAPPRNGTRATTRPVWPPGAASPTGGGAGGGVAALSPTAWGPSPARMRPASAASPVAVGGSAWAAAPSPRYRSRRSVSRTRDRTTAAAPSPTVAAHGKPPLARSVARTSARARHPGGRRFSVEWHADEQRGINLLAFTGEKRDAHGFSYQKPRFLRDNTQGGRGIDRLAWATAASSRASGQNRSPAEATRCVSPFPPRAAPFSLTPQRTLPHFDPDPALRLERALCYTGGDLPGTNAVVFVGPEAEYMAFPCNNVIVLMETPVMPEVVFPEGGVGFGIFLRGHTDTVTRLRLSHAGHLLASAQGDPLGAAGGHGIVRIWDTTSFGRRTTTNDGNGGARGGRRTNGGGGGGGGGGGSGAKCAAHFVAHRWGVSSVCFSSDDRLLCTVIVWDVALLCTARAGTVHGAGSGLAVVARQISDFPITKMLFSPFEKLRLVSCGRENVRFWRVRRRHLPACPAVLNDFARDLECTDLDFQSSCRGIAGVEDRTNWTEGPCVVYVSSRAGTVLQVSYHTRNLLCVLQLHDGPILSLEVKEDYAVTGSEDKFLRLWPLDFSDFLMEAAHESAVASVCSSADGLKLAVGTSAGSIGVLDVMTHGYTTALRSHRGAVTAVAVDPLEERDEFATVSEDCTVRVWDLVTGAQRYQFSSPADRATCLAYAPRMTSPTPAMLFHAEDLVFDVPSTSTLWELKQHRSAVQQVVYTPDGTRVVSAGEDGLLCVYDVSQGYRPTRTMACDEPHPERPISLSVSPGSDRLAVIGTEPSCILLYDLATMILKGRLGKPGGSRPGRSMPGGGGVTVGGGGMLQPWKHRTSSFDGTTGGGSVAVASESAASGGFLHAAFSGDGADLLACTATKFFRFPLGGG
ncbi:unnamed protein product [Scytosiphon promiscuus]